MAIHVVTDSTADLPPSIAQELGITVVPLSVHFGSETYRDGVDITPDEFFRRLTSERVLPKTSQPSVGAFAEVYTALRDQGHEVISIHISEKLSGTLNSARTAAQQTHGATIEPVDSTGASLWTGLAAVAAARAARDGASHREAVEVARTAIQGMRLYFVLDTLEYLHKGGRVGKAQALLGSLLSIKPVLTIREGEVHAHERVRTRARALARIREIAWAEGPFTEAAVLHATTPQEMQALAHDLQPLSPQRPVITGRVGPVIGTYSGPGVLGFVAYKA